MDLFIEKTNYELLSPSEAASFLVLNYIQTSKHNEITVAIDNIFYMMTGRFPLKKDKYMLKCIERSIDSLTTKEMIKSKKTIRHSIPYYIIQSDTLVVDTKNSKFYSISLEDYQTIFSLGQKGFNALRMYLYLIGAINYKKDGSCHSFNISQDTISNRIGLNKETVVNYFEILDKLKLVYVYQPNQFVMGQTIKNMCNTYGKYADKAYIIKEAQENLANYATFPIKEYQINRTSVRLKYNFFCSGAKKYKDNPALVEELKQLCQEYNDSFSDEQLKEREWAGRPTLLDLSVFGE